MAQAKLTSVLATGTPKLSEVDLGKYLDSIEDLKMAEACILSTKAEYEYLLAGIAKKRVEHAKLIRRLSKEYGVALYDKKFDVDILTGEVKEGLKNDS